MHPTDRPKTGAGRLPSPLLYDPSSVAGALHGPRIRIVRINEDHLCKHGQTRSRK